MKKAISFIIESPFRLIHSVATGIFHPPRLDYYPAKRVKTPRDLIDLNQYLWGKLRREEYLHRKEVDDLKKQLRRERQRKERRLN